MITEEEIVSINVLSIEGREVVRISCLMSTLFISVLLLLINTKFSNITSFRVHSCWVQVFEEKFFFRNYLTPL